MRCALSDRFGVRHEWKPAAAWLAKLMELNQFDGLNFASHDALRYAPVLLVLGDKATYEQFRSQCIARFRTTRDLVMAERIIKACLLIPADQSLDEPIHLHDIAINDADPRNDVAAAGQADDGFVGLSSGSISAIARRLRS